MISMTSAALSNTSSIASSEASLSEGAGRIFQEVGQLVGHRLVHLVLYHRRQFGDRVIDAVDALAGPLTGALYIVDDIVQLTVLTERLLHIVIESADAL